MPELAVKNFPTEFQQVSLATLNRVVPGSASIFALVDPSVRNKGVVLRNLDLETDRQYQTVYSHLDPLHPRHFADASPAVVCLDEVLTEAEILASRYYREFMLPRRQRYVADLFLRRDREVVAFVSLIRGPELANYTAGELALLRNLQPLLEFSLNSIYRPQRTSERSLLAASFHLTGRELDLLEHLIAGVSNKAIADRMCLSLSTVKTHLQHIFDKLAVTSRAQLLAKIFQVLK